MKNKERKNLVRLGLFVTAGLALFIVAIFFIGKQKHLFDKTITIHAIFEDISGLQVGNNVRFSGINVGRVDDIIIISDSSVQVDLVIDRDVQEFIKKDAKAVVGSEGLMGNKVVSISPGTTGSTRIIEDGDRIGTKKLASMDEIMNRMDSVAANAVIITNDLSAVIGGVRSGKGLIGKLIYDPTMAKTIDQTMTNVEGATEQLEENLEALEHNFLFRKGFKVKAAEEEAAKKAREKAIADSVKAAEKKKKN